MINLNIHPRQVASGILMLTTTEKVQDVFVRCVNNHPNYADICRSTPTLCSVIENLDMDGNPCDCDLCVQLHTFITSYRVAEELTK